MIIIMEDICKAPILLLKALYCMVQVVPSSPCLSVCLPVCLSPGLSVSMPITYLSVFASFCLSLSLSCEVF